MYNVASDTHEVVKHMITHLIGTESNLHRVYMYVCINSIICRMANNIIII